MFFNKKVGVIAAVSKNGVYGQGGKIPWSIPAEQNIFRKRTKGHAVIMGRKTWESLPAKLRPLPVRENIVITERQDAHVPGARVSSILKNAVQIAESKTVFVIGGRSLWFEAMEFADEAWITIVRTECAVDQETTSAPALVTPHLYWEKFVLHEIDKHPSVGNAPAFDIHHWVRI